MKRRFMKYIGMILLLCAISICYGALSEEESLPLGSYDGDTYTNDYIGIGCTLEGWRYDTLSELATRSQLNINEVSEEMLEVMQKTKAFILMYAASPDYSQSICIAVSYADGTSALVDLFGMQTILEKLFPQIMEQYTSLYGPETVGRIISRDIDGKTFYGYMISYIQNNEQIYWEQLTTNAGNYYVTTTASASSEELADSIYNHFFLLPAGKNDNKEKHK